MPDDNSQPSFAKAALRLAVQRGREQVPSRQGGVLSFSSWFALDARRLDIILLVLELVALNCDYMLKLYFRRACLPVGGSPDAALQALPFPTHMRAASSTATLASFPCGATYPRQLLHMAASGALTDPWVRVRAGDYVNLAHNAVQMTVVMVALLYPKVYMYTRHWLFFLVNAAVVIGMALSVKWTPPDLLPLVGAACLSRFKGRTMLAYLVWKPIFVLRVPPSHQALFGPLLWALTMWVMHSIDRALPGADMGGHDDVGGRHVPGLVTAAMSFISMCGLPYAVAVAMERAVLYRKYDWYVRREGRIGVSSNSSSGTGGGSSAGDEVRASCSNITQLSQSKGAARSPNPPRRPTEATCMQSQRSAVAAAPASPMPAAGTGSIASDSGTASGRGGPSSPSSHTCSPKATSDGTSPRGAPSAHTCCVGDVSTIRAIAASPVRRSGSFQQHRQMPAAAAFVGPPQATLQRKAPLRVAATPKSPATPLVRQGPDTARPVLDIGHLLDPRPRRHSAPVTVCSSSNLPSLYASLASSNLLSVKIPLPHSAVPGSPAGDSTFQAASSQVVAAASVAIRRHNAAAAAAVAVAASSSAGAWGAGAGGGPDVAASCLGATPPRVVPVSCVCVRGCVHLLLVVHGVAGGPGQEGGRLLARHASVELLVGEEEEGGGAQLASAVDSAVSDMLSQLGGGAGAGGEGGSGIMGGSGGHAAVWPPAVPMWEGRRAAAAVSGGGEEEAADGGVDVVAACGVSLLRGLGAVRCVVTGHGAGVGATAEVQLGSGGGVEPFGQGPERGRVYLDCIVPAAVEVEQQQQPLLPQGEGEAAAEVAERVKYLRLQLPRSALLSPGVLTLHLLPPPSTSTPPDHLASVPSGLPRPHPHAPLCFLPLLVLPAAAVREVEHLHAYAVARELGWAEEEGHGEQGEGGEQLQQGAVEGNATYNTRVSDMLMGVRGCVAAGAAAAIAALHGNGMYSLSYDFGALLDLPYNTADCTADSDVAPAPDPWAFSGMLRLMAEQGMGACLRMGQGAMQRAGVRLEAGGDGAAGTGAGIRAPAEDLGLFMGTMQGASVEGPSGAGDQGLLVQDSLECEQQQDSQGSPFRTPGSVPEAHGQGSIPVDLTHVQPFAQASCKDATAGAGPSTPPSPDNYVPQPPPQPLMPAPPPPPPRGPSWRWWLRTLLLGFQPTALEATYQRTFKAARCCACDCAALALHVAVATVSAVRMVRNGGEHGGEQQDADCAIGVSGVHTCPPSVGARGGYDPQLASQVLWMGSNLLSLLLMALTPLHARHRNAALLLRGFFSAAALTAITWTAPVGSDPAVGMFGGAASHTRPWFLVPDGWVINCQRYSLHWLLFSLWDPAMLQLSLPLQAVVSAAYLVPTALLQLRVHPAAAAATTVGEGHGGGGGGGGDAAAWRAAVVYAVGTEVCGLVISAVTDLAGRMAFMAEQQRRGPAEGPQQPRAESGPGGMQCESAGGEVVQEAEVKPKVYKARGDKDGAGDEGKGAGVSRAARVAAQLAGGV